MLSQASVSHSVHKMGGRYLLSQVPSMGIGIWEIGILGGWYMGGG